MTAIKYIAILLFLFIVSLVGCTYGHITENINRTPATISRQGEGKYQYYILIKGKDGKMHLYPITMPKQEEPKVPDKKKTKSTELEPD